MCYDFEIQYRKGLENNVLDAMSCLKEHFLNLSCIRLSTTFVGSKAQFLNGPSSSDRWPVKGNKPNPRDLLEVFSRDRPITWVKHLSWAEWNYNTLHYSAINMTTHEAIYGYPPPPMISFEPGMIQDVEIER